MLEIEYKINNFIEKMGGDNYFVNLNDFKEYLKSIYNQKKWNNNIYNRLKIIINNIELKEEFKLIFRDHNEFNNIHYKI